MHAIQHNIRVMANGIVTTPIAYNTSNFFYLSLIKELYNHPLYIDSTTEKAYDTSN